MGMKPALNWRELEQIAAWIAPEITGMFVDRIVVPVRPEFPDGYLKHEWAIRLTSRGKEAVLLFSIRPNHPGITWISGKGPRASTIAPRSGFDLSLGKLLSGRKVTGFSAVPNERTLALWLDGGYALILTLIPALPEALLVEAKPEDLNRRKSVPVLARSRTSRESGGNAQYVFPDGAGSPVILPLREGAFATLETYVGAEREASDLEAFELRLTRVRSRITQDLKQAKTRKSQSLKTLETARSEGDYRHLGDLLKSVMGLNPELSPKNTRTVLDWETGAETEIKCDPRLGLKEQVEKFYSLAKRKERRLTEADLRLTTFTERAAALEAMRKEIDRIALDLVRGETSARKSISALAPFETKLGFNESAPETAEAKAIKGKGTTGRGGWTGKTFLSKEGLPILVGRSKDENLELTFKFARGNDLWMHVKGKPGAHVVVPLRDKKNASLETLLDAAYLCLHYSGGANWGKTEVDYTSKKYVKRIRDSSEASYVSNKTLIVEIDRARLDALLSQEIL
jgi:predicted ribosome quality control (RQC) complex YloA/Tae2 family protein